MRQIPIRKETLTKKDELIESFFVPAMSFAQSDGQIKKFPHPEGTDTISFSSFEKAQEAINRAGYNYSLSDFTSPVKSSQLENNPNLNTITSHLIESLKDKSLQVVASAIYSLGEISSTQAIDKLIEYLGHTDSSIRNNSIEALAKTGNPAIPALIRSFDETNWEKNNSIIICLGEMSNYKANDMTIAINPVITKLNDNNPVIRSSAAIVLGKMYKSIKNRNDMIFLK